MLELVLAFFLGVGIGVVAGLLPGIHPNNTIPLVLALASFFQPLAASIVLVTAGIVNSFIAFIPSIFLGAPDDAEAMGVLPGHRMLLQGRGMEAIRLTVFGGLGTIIIGIAVLPLVWLIIPPIYIFIRPNTHWLLITTVAYLLFCELSARKMAYAMLIFSVAGILGYVALDYFVIQDGMLPLLSGLFGVPTLIVALSEKPNLPETAGETGGEKLSKHLPGVFTGIVAGLLAGLLPGIGSSQSAMLVQGKDTDDGGCRFLVALGGISAADVIYSLFALWLIGNPRSGIAVAVGQLMNVGLNEILIFCVVGLAAAAVGAFLTLRLAHRTLRWLRRVDYRKLCAWVLFGIVSIVALLSGVAGLCVLAAATAIGLLTTKLGVRRSWAMGCLIVPTIMFFAGL